MEKTLLALAVALLAGCATTGPTDTTGPADVDGFARLSAGAWPTAYELELTIDPRKDRFSGKTTIHVVIPEPTREIVLHGLDLTIQSARAISGDLAIDLRSSEGAHGGLLLTSEAPISGELRLEITYDAPLREGLDGLYRTSADGRWFAFTQFEPMDARRAFPCFDEPVFKTPFTATLRVPVGMKAFTNTPQTGEETADGWSVVRFATSKPLPTYLVAFAVGDIVARSGPTEETDGVPFRILAARGREHLATWALERTPAILGAISDYFGEPLPYAKLDLIGVPNFGYGAMENVGLVTFRERLLLLDPDNVPPQAIEYGISVIAHELAHMWFGNLVTMPWWDDLWLNEAFATWLEGKITAGLEPALETAAADVMGAQWVMGLDVKTHARSIREPIAHGGDVQNAFDGITYTKGATILGMAEGWIGEAAMRVGLRAYMKDHAHAGGTTADLFAALDGATDKPVSAMLASFTDQPGVPRVDVTLRCDGPPRMVIRQERHLRAESGLDRARLWKIPVCFRYPVKGLVTSSCVLLDSSELEVPLEGKECPIWLHPNPDERGYYRWSVPKDSLAQLVGPYRSALTLREKMAILPNLWALVTADRLPARTYLEAIDHLAAETHPLVVERVAGALSGLAPHARGLGIEADLAKRIQERLGHHAARIGDERVEGETPRTTMLRNHLRSVLGDAGKDPALRKAAREKTDRFLGDPSQVPEGLGTALAMAAWDGDGALFDRFLSASQGKVSPQVRTELVRALGSFSDPALTVRGLDAVIDGPLRTQDLRVIYG
jgi:alanyl aminopeptidase